jgi:threonine aldolase
MYEAEVGDDVFAEDPTVNRLQEQVADLLGKEKALYVCSGTMGNLLSLMAQTEPGGEVILEAESHIRYYEGAGSAAFCGIQLYPIPGERGVIPVDALEKAVRAEDHHYPKSSLVVIENTHNRWGGAVIPIEKIQEIEAVARSKGLKMHMDGARLFNAEVATGVPAREYARFFDTVTVCFSKGLGVPMGSMIASDADTIEKIHRYRKMIGGGQRQIGIVAAAALYALEHHVKRLTDDHQNAKRLADALADMPGVSINPDEVDTNIVIFDVEKSGMNAVDVMVKMGERGVLMLPFGEMLVRCVTHLEIDKDDIDKAIAGFSEIFTG